MNKNKLRIELGLPTLDKNWFIEKTESINKKLKVSNQVWKNADTLAFHKYKEVVYRKSFWIGKNEIIQEIDSYTNYISESEYELLISQYDFKSDSWFVTLDTFKNNKLVNEKWRLNYNGGIEMGIIGTDKKYLDRIIEKWEK
ncbi:hypothetical protein H3Z83_12675 [Tenacibaculum sp. S7007]|uniref:Uncharacterized protein n=1 Tax=Tenacibaculum pelagium TaxID=2759527 RepID=A0A839ATF0_9FLAO|nr:hypothetical protein [Tenacibaculum pelagium]MBA6157364.1 hypothetical protein [Tenacibaculum pelagium]